MDKMFQVGFHVPGTLAANVTITWTTPCDLQLIHVSATGSGANDGKLTIGKIGSLAAYLASTAIGDSDAPVECDRDDFVDTQYPHIPKGTIMNIGLDFDGSAGTATPNFTVMLTFTEG